MKNILGVRFDEVNLIQAGDIVKQFLAGNEVRYIFTPNPEMLVDAHRDRYFLETLNAGDLNICDGAGITLLTGLKKIAGVDLAEEICRLAAEQGKSVYLLGTGRVETTRAAAVYLQQRFPNLRIAGLDPGHRLALVPGKSGARLQYSAAAHEEILHRLIMAAPDVLLVAFGHNKQEKWIIEFAHQVPSLKIAMGVGGTFSFWAGTARRAPSWMQNVGLEWLWRLMWEPRRLGRIIKALFAFPILFWLRNGKQ